MGFTTRTNMSNGYIMCPYSLYSHVVTNGIYDYKSSHNCNHICHVLV